ncbi:glycosyltransferase family 4 protein [Tateyamaria omphalii]|uniref:glycosyltransferase family 4 protein n=1 Tax=Tateyamaria omphalii TaxID=299262 RepID=UPI001C98E967|nr:glycosyltransferase family 4 protein [Tateyamaria omphalii]MBY5935600.1 glycosyltransferase family 4 protein [Tateyamaria omphalii]
MIRAVFAIPGDKDRRTGGFIYEARILAELNALGCDTAHLQLPDSFPDPTPIDMHAALDALKAVPGDVPIILDGLVFGAIDPAGLAQVAAPVIAMVHHPLGLETGLSKARADFLLQNEAEALRHTDHVIVPSPETARVLCRDLGADPERITVALPGFDRPTVNRAPIYPPLILSVGLLAPRKGHDLLLSALGQLRDLSWQADIVGKTHDPEYAASLHDQTAALRIEDRVSFSGEVEQAGLAARFNAATVFALATRYEGYGMVLSEAMQYGLPVVSCNVGAVPETVGAAAMLVPPEDPATLATALRQIIQDRSKAKELSELSVSKAATLPRWEETAEIFVSVINRLGTDNASERSGFS